MASNGAQRLLKIVHLDTSHELRGGQHQLLLLARGLGERGHGQMIVCPRGSALEEKARQEKFVVYPMPPYGLGALRSLPGLRRRIIQDAFQVLHAHDGRGQTMSALTSLGLPVRRVATRRVTFMPQGLSRTLRLHRLQYGPACDAIIAVSGFIRDVLVSSGIARRKIELIPDGVEIPVEVPNTNLRARVRREWGLDPRAFVIGHAGAFTAEKGQDVLLEAFLQASALLPGAQLLLAGDGPLRGSARFSELVGKAQGRARLLGWMENLTPFFAAIDLYAMPSRAEGLGSSAILAMAHGLPVAASRVGGLSEVVEEEQTGWLVPPDSPPALAEVLAAAASDRERLCQWGARARERARAFCSDIMVDRTEALYRRLTAIDRATEGTGNRGLEAVPGRDQP